jgi:AraC-like DNA-binding protein
MARALEQLFGAAGEEAWIAGARSSIYRSSTLAQICQVSSRQLRRHFQQRFGRSPQDWLDEQRMLAAGPLLRKVRSVKQAAYELGFKQVSHFSRAFKEFYGINPTAYLILKPSSLGACPPEITNVRAR